MPFSKHFSESKLNQSGIAQILILILLVTGLGAGLVLSQNTQIFSPKASESQSQPPPPSPIPSPIACNARLASVSLSNPCNEVKLGFRTIEYSCAVGGEVTTQSGDGAGVAPQPACRSMEDLVRAAQKKCAYSCPIPVPSPSPSLTYTCKIMNDKINASFGTTCGDSAYDPVADVNKDRSVTILDFSAFSAISTDETACKKMNDNTVNPCPPPVHTLTPL